MVAWAGAERLALGLAEEPPAPWLGGGEGEGEGEAEGARREVPGSTGLESTRRPPARCPSVKASLRRLPALEMLRTWG